MLLIDYKIITIFTNFAIKSQIMINIAVILLKQHVFFDMNQENIPIKICFK